MNIIKRLLAQMHLTRATDRPFNDVGQILPNMDSEAKKAIREVATTID